jgi:hypothetical protein
MVIKKIHKKKSIQINREGNQEAFKTLIPKKIFLLSRVQFDSKP